MPNPKPVLVHKTITYLRPDMVDDEVEELVAKLTKQGYKNIKVIVHEIINDVYRDGSNHSIYTTTVLATLKINIDISQSK